MAMTYGERDRAKASEHAVFFARAVDATVAGVLRDLATLAARLGDDLTLRLTPAGEVAETRFELQLAARNAPQPFFDGEVRIERAPSGATHVALVGRITRPGDCAERRVADLFDRLVPPR